MVDDVDDTETAAGIVEERRATRGHPGQCSF
jgi:hypothetical protein